MLWQPALVSPHSWYPTLNLLCSHAHGHTDAVSWQRNKAGWLYRQCLRGWHHLGGFTAIQGLGLIFFLHTKAKMELITTYIEQVAQIHQEVWRISLRDHTAQDVTGNSQFWLHAGPVSSTLTFAFCCFCYYKHTKWPASGNPAHLCLNVKPKCLCSGLCPPVAGYRKEEVIYPLLEAGHSRRYLWD